VREVGAEKIVIEKITIEKIVIGRTMAEKIVIERIIFGFVVGFGKIEKMAVIEKRRRLGS